MAMIVPDYHGNPNEYHWSPKTSSLVPAVGKPNKATIQAVMGAIEKYGVVENYPQFVKDFASVHRGFYDSFVAGRGFHEGLRRLAESNFEGALLKNMIEKLLDAFEIENFKFNLRSNQKRKHQANNLLFAVLYFHLVF